MADELLYPNAPLVEVIVELHWKLKPVLGGRMGESDPFLELFMKDFAEWAKGNGFPHEDRVVPQSVPLEFLAHKGLVQYRPERNKWPLYQVGPGVLTVNATPPYGGWTKFRPVVMRGVEALFATYPMAAKTLVFEKLELHYIDAFRKEHGVKAPAAFLRDELKLVAALPGALFEFGSGSPEDVTTAGEVTIPLKQPKDSVGVLRYGPGLVNNTPAILLDFTIASKPETTPSARTDIERWLEDAHTVCSKWFQALLSPSVRAALEKS